ncbi:hypothetical protein Tco_1356826, partial [Tanacetum coccineum]
KKLFAWHLKLYGHSRHGTVGRLKHIILKLKWRTSGNFHDCGVFTMLHMESFNGETAAKWDCGLSMESGLQCDMLRRLRFKFATKILLHEIIMDIRDEIKLSKGDMLPDSDENKHRNKLPGVKAIDRVSPIKSKSKVTGKSNSPKSRWFPMYLNNNLKVCEIFK